MNPTQIDDEDVYWEMTWNQKQFPDKPAVEVMFEEDKALARLLAAEVIFTNTNWWQKEWPQAARRTTALCVNCNDIFAWGCADAEIITRPELQGLYDQWLASPNWGGAIWCCFKRSEKPQRPVADAMKRDGVWSEGLESLNENCYDRLLREKAAGK